MPTDDSSIRPKRCCLIGEGHECAGEAYSVRVVHTPTGKKSKIMSVCAEALRSLTYYLFPEYRKLVDKAGKP